jgi:predicted transcriptional regulator
MANCKDSLKSHVVSMRVNNKEKAMLDEITRVTCMNISKIMREAIRFYSPQ